MPFRGEASHRRKLHLEYPTSTPYFLRTPRSLRWRLSQGWRRSQVGESNRRTSFSRSPPVFLYSRDVEPKSFASSWSYSRIDRTKLQVDGGVWRSIVVVEDVVRIGWQILSNNKHVLSWVIMWHLEENRSLCERQRWSAARDDADKSRREASRCPSRLAPLLNNSTFSLNVCRRSNSLFPLSDWNKPKGKSNRSKKPCFISSKLISNSQTDTSSPFPTDWLTTNQRKTKGDKVIEGR